TTEVAVAEIIEKNSFEESCLISSYFHTTIKIMKSYSQKIHTVALITGEPVNIAEMVKQASAEAAFANQYYITPQMVSKLHNAGMKIFVGNCNTEEDIKCMLKLKVDGICSDLPDLLARVLEEK
ncbi:MAG: glycerophosphodiester phosphodiesterase family protein, partial [Candidatus Woesearchaeota archaeon]